MRILLSIFLLVFSTICVADGYEFRNGRFPQGKITVLRLTLPQKQLISLYRHCRDNTRTPYIFSLTRTQRAVLRRESGLAPKRFAIFESIHGDDGIELEFNSINRFDQDHIEIPHVLLRTDSFVRDWEVNTMGWAPSPLASASSNNLTSGSCPK